MFEELRLYDFQNHKFRKVKFGPITSIVGLSDAGKTALMRAMGAVCLNKPSDKSMVRDGRKAFTVKLKADGKWVTRKRGKRTNVYLVGKKRFAAFGNKVPPEVLALLNVDEGNFQRQLDKHFWFGDTAGQVSKHLNEIVNLELIDKVLAGVGSEVRKASSSFEHTTGRFRQAKKVVKDLAWADEFVAGVGRLEQLDSDLRANRVTIDSAARTIAELRQTLTRHRIASEATLEGEKALARFKSYFPLDRKCRKLERLVKEVEEAEELVKDDVPDLTRLKRLREKGDAVALKVYELEEAIDQITQLEDEVCQTEESLRGAEAELRRRRVKGNRCPTCGQKVKTSSRPSSRTSTSRTTARSPGPKRTSGRKSSSHTCNKSGTSVTNTRPPW